MELSKEQLQKELEFAAVQQNTGICETYSYCRLCKELKTKTLYLNSETPCADAYLDLQEITAKLKSYKENKEYIKIAVERINLWTIALNSKDKDKLAELFDSSEAIDLGMPRAEGKISSPIESELQKHEITREMVKMWITREQSKLDGIRIEVNQLKRIFKKLKEEDMFIIECKCFDNLKWTDTQISYQNKFKKHLDESVLRKRLARIKEKIRNLIKIEENLK